MPRTGVRPRNSSGGAEEQQLVGLAATAEDVAPDEAWVLALEAGGIADRAGQRKPPEARGERFLAQRPWRNSGSEGVSPPALRPRSRRCAPRPEPPSRPS